MTVYEMHKTYGETYLELDGEPWCTDDLIVGMHTSASLPQQQGYAEDLERDITEYDKVIPYDGKLIIKPNQEFWDWLERNYNFLTVETGSDNFFIDEDGNTVTEIDFVIAELYSDFSKNPEKGKPKGEKHSWK